MTALDILKKYYGYDSFRSPQDEIISSINDKNDTVALLPTGGGKSLCFQIPALMGRHKKALIISPLISLMNDQIDNLEKKKIKGIAIHSGLSKDQIDIQIDNFIFGKAVFLYISPERLLSPIFQARLSKMKLDLIAVDEAHCISQWGFDFRPAYLSIPVVREFHPMVPIVALTATASEKVLKDIVNYLNLENPNIFRKSFERENINFFAIKTVNKLNELLNIVNRVKGSGIIYTRNRRNTKQISDWFSRHNIKSVSYHAGMTSADRVKAQDQWKNNKVRLAVATNAFGMGIDKSDVTFVIHLDIPNSIEEYYQEAGRAGRDGSKSYAICLLNDADILNAKTLFEKQYPDFEALKKVYIKLAHYFKLAIGSGQIETFPFVLDDFSEYIGLDFTILTHALKILENEGWISLSDGFVRPSLVLITATKENIYSLTYQDPIYDEILSTLLRNYEGIWSFHTKIDEQKIAKILHTTKSKIESKLLILYKDGVIDYHPSLEESAITFIRPRPQNDHFAIERHRYEASKTLAKERLNQMIGYLTKDQCRQQYILNYFGENKAVCGKCDICMGSMNVTMKPADLKILKNHLKQIKSGLDLEVYLMAWPYHKRNAVRHTLKTYEEKEMMQIKNGKIFINSSKLNTIS